MWPFDRGDATTGWLAIYIATFALHAVFTSYVIGGTVFVLAVRVRGRADELADRVCDRLPFMLGLAITAGVGPLLFIQLLYQRHFYTANLIAGPRFGAIIPALIVGFYALYVANASERRRTAALMVAALCFLFIAWSWSELHLLARDETAWVMMYAAGQRVYGNHSIAPRGVLWLGWMASTFAIVALWSASATDRRRLAVIAVVGRGVAGCAALWFVLHGAAIEPAARSWSYLLVAALAIELAGWIATLRAPDGRGPALATAGAAIALIAGAVIREAPRLVLLEPPRGNAETAGGVWVFAITLAFGIAAIAWVVRTVRR